MRISDWSSDVCSSDLSMYTIHVKGVEGGQVVADVLLVSAISRVVVAAKDWDAILNSARSPALAIVVSNTTEIGIVLDEQDDLFASPPRSFPGKLTAVLFERFQVFNGAEDKGLVVLRSEEHTSELQSLMRISYAVF